MEDEEDGEVEMITERRVGKHANRLLYSLFIIYLALRYSGF